MNTNKWNFMQMFAEDAPEAAESAPEQKEDAPETKPEDEKKYSDKDVDAIIDKKFAAWQKRQEDAVAEAKKLGRMNAEEKQAYEMDKLTKERDALKAEVARIEMEKSASSILKEHGIDATQDMLSFVVGADAETTKANIDAFVGIIQAQLKAAEVKRNTGTTPRSYGAAGELTEIQKRMNKYK